MNEKTNTMRLLAGQNPLITSIWCRFGWHNWTQWSETFIESKSCYQDSFCAHCNKRRAREVTANYR